jgi:hypothetical protein
MAALMALIAADRRYYEASLFFYAVALITDHIFAQPLVVEMFSIMLPIASAHIQLAPGGVIDLAHLCHIPPRLPPA